MRPKQLLLKVWIQMLALLLVVLPIWQAHVTEAISSSPSSNITISKVTAARSQMVNVPVMITSTGNVRGLQFDLVYDSRVMQLVNASLGSGVPRFTIYHNPVNGRIMVVSMNEDIPSGTKELAVLQFEVGLQGPAQSTVGLQHVVISNVTANNITNGFSFIEGEVKIDETAPAITLTAQPQTPTNQDVAISVDVDGTGSQVKAKKWAAGDYQNNFSYFRDGGTTLSQSSFSVSSNGVYTVYAQDGVGNQSTKTISIENIDKESPVITGVEEGKVYPPGTVIQATDKNGVSATVDNQPYTLNTPFSEDGQHTLQVTDEAGNHVVIHFTIDASKPLVSGIRDGEVTNQDVTLTFTEGAGTLNQQPYLSGTPITASGTYDLRVVDSFGNETLIRFIIDKVNPAVVLAKSAVQIQAGNVTITATTLDGTGSDLVSKKWAVGDQPISYFANAGTDLPGNQFTVTENGTYTVYAKDAAGNQTVQTIKVIVRGDVNQDGVIDTLDLTLVGEYIVGNQTFTDEQRFAADAKTDLQVDVLDWLTIAVMALNFNN